MKHLVVPVTDRVSLLISVWLLTLVKMVAHVLLLVILVTVVSVHHSTMDSTVKVLFCYCDKFIQMLLFLEMLDPGDAFYIPFLNLTGDEVLTLPPVDDGSYPISLPEPLPLGNAHNMTTYYTTAYVSHNLLAEWHVIIIG